MTEQLDYNLPYRWFVGIGVDDPVWVPTVLTKNRDRLLDAEVARTLLVEQLNHEQIRTLLVDVHFSVDGTQILAWASMKSFQSKDGSSSRPIRVATASAISTAKSAATRRMPRPPIPRPGCTARVPARRPS